MKDGEHRHAHLKFCIRAGQNDDWAMYMAPGDWPDSQVAAWGSKVPEELAVGLVKLMDVRVEFPEGSPIDILKREWRD